MDYLDIKNPPAAARLDERIRDSVASLAEFPNRGRPGRIVGTRELVMSDLPYIVVYRVTFDQLWILRIMHGARSLPEAFR
ncbi:MAG: type II toxin-antitoxin system RelE/ParE family toxin [Magnetospirillum sp. WYHS-4]